MSENPKNKINEKEIFTYFDVYVGTIQVKIFVCMCVCACMCVSVCMCVFACMRVGWLHSNDIDTEKLFHGQTTMQQVVVD